MLAKVVAFWLFIFKFIVVAIFYLASYPDQTPAWWTETQHGGCDAVHGSQLSCDKELHIKIIYIYVDAICFLVLVNAKY